MRCRYVGTDSIYTLTSAYERDESCPVCSPGVTLEVPPGSTLGGVIEAMMADPGLGKHLSAPSVSHGATNLYMRGALEELTRPNLAKVSWLPYLTSVCLVLFFSCQALCGTVLLLPSSFPCSCISTSRIALWLPCSP